jgi:purine nucleosidase
MKSDNPRIPVIIDTDPGQDDAVAILFALAAKDQLDVLGITTVSGNVPLGLTTRNARIIVDWSGRTDVAVYSGCARPLLRPVYTAESVHGKEGLEGVPLHEPKTPLHEKHAVDFLVSTLSQAPNHAVTICCIGPLTNLACALTQAPEIVRGIKKLVLMGGAYFVRGNITPTAEFNIYVDPHAAAIVFASGIPIIVFPLDVTYKVLATSARIETLGNTGNNAGRLISQILTSYERRTTAKSDSPEGPLHDPCTIAYLLDPSLFSGRRVNVQIETNSDLTLGETVVDWPGKTQNPPNALWITDADSDRFFALLTKSVSRLP